MTDEAKGLREELIWTIIVGKPMNTKKIIELYAEDYGYTRTSGQRELDAEKLELLLITSMVPGDVFIDASKKAKAIVAAYIRGELWK